MYRVILYFSFLSVCLNWPQISAEETTISQETSKDSTVTPKSDEETKTNEDHDISLSKTSTEKTKTRKDARPENDSSENRSQKSSRDSGIKTPYVSEIVSLELDENEKNKDRNDFVIKHEHKASNDSNKNSQNSKSEDSLQESKEKDTSYMETLTSSLLIPVLKTQNQFGKALRHTNEAIKNFGAGTFEAASGAFNFFKDAATAVMKSG